MRRKVFNFCELVQKSNNETDVVSVSAVREQVGEYIKDLEKVSHLEVDSENLPQVLRLLRPQNAKLELIVLHAERERVFRQGAHVGLLKERPKVPEAVALNGLHLLLKVQQLLFSGDKGVQLGI